MRLEELFAGALAFTYQAENVGNHSYILMLQ